MELFGIFFLFNTFFKKGNEKWKERNKRERAVTAKKCDESQKRRREYPIEESLKSKPRNMAIQRKGGGKEERIVNSEEREGGRGEGREAGQREEERGSEAEGGGSFRELPRNTLGKKKTACHKAKH